MGFEKDVSSIISALSERSQCQRQTILLSATLSSGLSFHWVFLTFSHLLLLA